MTSTDATSVALQDDEIVGARGVLARLRHGLVGVAGPTGGHDVAPVTTWAARALAEGPVWELSMRVQNRSSADVGVDRMDPLDLTLVGHGWRTRWYTSRWGAEFAEQHGDAAEGLELETRSGRSSHGQHPWLGLESTAGALIVSPAWSGNWHVSVDPSGQVTAGVSPWRMRVDLAPGGSIDAPPVVVAAGDTLDAAILALQRSVRDGLLARTEFTDAAPTEWNHWWPYEDQDVDEVVIERNAHLAVDAGVEVVTVDAGWFGAADAGGDWRDERGDWSRVNTARFPAGLSRLGEGIRDAGALAGMWIEPEAVGRSARARTELSGAVALGDPAAALPFGITVSLDADDPSFLGYLCLGSAAGREHARGSIERVIMTTGARWIKIDFNVDPGAGCTRTDHGHGAGDGLLRHYEGLYGVLDTVRARHPDVLLEACSSGGLRIDLGLARHVHAFYLSDRDHTRHHLSVLAGATRMLPPLGVLHWSQSQWRGDDAAQSVDWANLEPGEFDRMLRAAMLHRFGVSLALPDLSAPLRERLARHVEVFRETVAPLLPHAVLRAPAPHEDGDAVLQLTDETSDRHVLAVLAGASHPAPLRVPHLRDDIRYRVEDLFGDAVLFGRGAELGETGVPLIGTATTRSWLIAVSAAERAS